MQLFNRGWWVHLCVEKSLAGKRPPLFVKHDSVSVCVTFSESTVMSERVKGGRKTTRQPHRSNRLYQVQFTLITSFDRISLNTYAYVGILANLCRYSIVNRFLATETMI